MIFLDSAHRFGGLSTIQEQTITGVSLMGLLHILSKHFRRYHKTHIADAFIGRAFVMEMVTPSNARIHDIEIPCFRCGTINHHRIEPGSGPHGAKLMCGHCEGFIRWLPKNPPEVREANRVSAIRNWMNRQPPTQPQLRYLQNLGYRGAKPTDRLQASTAIEKLRRARGWI